MPFGQFEELHFARFVILADPTRKILESTGFRLRPPFHRWPFWAIATATVVIFSRVLVAPRGYRIKTDIFPLRRARIPTDDLLQWMKDHSQPPAAMYVNWLGRTVAQIREESALRHALVSYLAGQTVRFATPGATNNLAETDRICPRRNRGGAA